MPDWEYQACHFSITCRTPDLAVVHCLRALCEFAEEKVRPQIGWGGTTARAWKSAGGRITLRFSDPAYRDRFVAEANRLLPAGTWAEVARSDADPAQRQRS